MTKALRLPLLCLAVVLFMGTGWFGARQTGLWLIPLLKTLAPWATTRDVEGMHMLLRKLGHLTQYAILARTWLLGVLAWKRPSIRTASWIALLVCVACAFIDEGHQAMLLTRTGSAADAVLDSLGALMMLMMLRARHEASALAPAVVTAP
jgi:VanZ family protein